MKPLDSRIQIFFALLTVELMLLPLKYIPIPQATCTHIHTYTQSNPFFFLTFFLTFRPHMLRPSEVDPIETEKATALPLYRHVLGFFQLLASGLAAKVPVVLSSSLYHLTTARFCTVAYSHDTFTKVAMYALLAFSCELILLDQFYIGFRSFALGVFVYSMGLLWESKFAAAVLMFSVSLNLNPVFLLALPAFLSYVVQEYILTFGPKRKKYIYTNIYFYIFFIYIKQVYLISQHHEYSALDHSLKQQQHFLCHFSLYFCPHKEQTYFSP